MASCGRYSSFLHDTLFTASEKSFNIRSSINRLTNRVAICNTPVEINYFRYNEESWTAKRSFQSYVISIVSMLTLVIPMLSFAPNLVSIPIMVSIVLYSTNVASELLSE